MCTNLTEVGSGDDAPRVFAQTSWVRCNCGFILLTGILTSDPYDFANSWAMSSAEQRCKRALPPSSPCNASSEDVEKVGPAWAGAVWMVWPSIPQAEGHPASRPLPRGAVADLCGSLWLFSVGSPWVPFLLKTSCGWSLGNSASNAARPGNLTVRLASQLGVVSDYFSALHSKALSCPHVSPSSSSDPSAVLPVENSSFVGAA